MPSPPWRTNAGSGHGRRPLFRAYPKPDSNGTTDVLYTFANRRRPSARRVRFDATSPTANLQAAQQAIAAAERGEAARYAPGELSEAHTKLASAETAVTENKMVVAEHFADQSRAEAELASAKTSAAKANAVNDE